MTPGVAAPTSTSGSAIVDDTTTEAADDGGDVGLIVGLVVGLSVAILIIALIFFFLWKKRSNKAAELPKNEEAPQPPASGNKASLENYEGLLLKDITIKDKIGSGSYGDVL